MAPGETLRRAAELFHLADRCDDLMTLQTYARAAARYVRLAYALADRDSVSA